jgi:hypothetical protein
VDDFPLTVWRYHLDVAVQGADRQNLPDALEGEDLDLFRDVARADAYAAIRAGRLRYDAAREQPAPEFVRDLSVLSLYLFEVVRGLEVAERYAREDVTDDVRAWKVVARRGEWVKVPLVVGQDAAGRFIVDPDREDLEVVAARWKTYPTWFHDGMRRKYPSLRALEP